MSDDAALTQEANLLGALALVVTDRTTDAIAAAAGQSGTAAAALSALHHFLDRPSIDLLRQVLGLTSSGTVRLVDRLVQAGYVTRGPGADGRSTAIELTTAGRRAAQRVSAARAAVLGEALAQLSAGERAALHRAMSRLLAGFVRGPSATRWLCRLCDTGACGRDAGHCPAANAYLERVS
ncbi:MAG TPA: MarR family transcriptional regulator, partial [Micromonosporaceae bacterium]|nr:MarR family transcriptional regulator [Micromonosporaceae bacterium]